MKYSQTLIIFCVIAFFATPFLSRAEMLDKVNVKSICAVAMADDAILPKFEKIEKPVEINAGQEFSTWLSLENKTKYTYKNTHMLYKVYNIKVLFDENKVVDAKEYLVDIIYSNDSYDISGGETKKINFKWSPNEKLEDGSYLVEAYVIYNDSDIRQNIAKHTSLTSTGFKLNNINAKKSEIRILKGKSSFKSSRANPSFLEPVTLVISGENTFTVPVKNDSNEDKNIKFSWIVSPYGKFDKENIILATSSTITLKRKVETKIELPIPENSNIKNQAILLIEDDHQKYYEIFRWNKTGKVVPLINISGIVEDGEFIAATTTNEGVFGLNKNFKYIAFACVEGSESGLDTTLKLTIKDDNKILFSKEESRNVKNIISSFEYPFEVKSFHGKYDLEVVATSKDLSEKKLWSSDCRDQKNSKCRSNSLWVYFIGIITIGMLFVVSYFIRNKSINRKQNDKNTI